MTVMIMVHVTRQAGLTVGPGHYPHGPYPPQDYNFCKKININNANQQRKQTQNQNENIVFTKLTTTLTTTCICGTIINKNLIEIKAHRSICQFAC